MSLKLLIKLILSQFNSLVVISITIFLIIFILRLIFIYSLLNLLLILFNFQLIPVIHQYFIYFNYYFKLLLVN